MRANYSRNFTTMDGKSSGKLYWFSITFLFRQHLMAFTASVHDEADNNHGPNQFETSLSA